jgi:hypothetical protein
LGFATRDKLDGFLKAHEVWLGYSVDDLERERGRVAAAGILEANSKLEKRNSKFGKRIPNLGRDDRTVGN